MILLVATHIDRHDTSFTTEAAKRQSPHSDLSQASLLLSLIYTSAKQLLGRNSKSPMPNRRIAGRGCSRRDKKENCIRQHHCSANAQASPIHTPRPSTSLNVSRGIAHTNFAADIALARPPSCIVCLQKKSRHQLEASRSRMKRGLA